MPFIFPTAYGEKGDLIKGRRLGADDYLVKSVDFDILLTTVAARLESVTRAKRRVTSRAQQLERDLSEFIAAGTTSTSLPHTEDLRRILEQNHLPDCLLVLTSIDAYHRPAQEFGTQVA